MGRWCFYFHSHRSPSSPPVVQRRRLKEVGLLQEVRNAGDVLKQLIGVELEAKTRALEKQSICCHSSVLTHHQVRNSFFLISGLFSDFSVDSN